MISAYLAAKRLAGCAAAVLLVMTTRLCDAIDAAGAGCLAVAVADYRSSLYYHQRATFIAEVLARLDVSFRTYWR